MPVDAIDDDMSVIDTLARLVRIDSVNPEWSGPGEREVATEVSRFFAEAGMETWEVEVLPGRPNVMARLPGRDVSRRVVLEVHLDTVSVADMTIPPFEPEIRDGLLYGRGACDVKAGLAAMMHAMRDLYRSGETPPCDVIFAAVIDEEHAYRGVLGLLESLRDGPLPEAAIVAEPTELRLIRANKGVLRWQISTRGVSAHSSKPHLGKSAIVAMASVIQALEADNARLARSVHPLVGPATCSIGIIEGGAQVQLLIDNQFAQNCRVLWLDGVGLVVRERAIWLEIEGDDLNGQVAEDPRHGGPGHTVPGVDRNAERAEARDIDHGEHVPGVVVKDVAVLQVATLGGRNNRREITGDDAVANQVEPIRKRERSSL